MSPNLKSGILFISTFPPRKCGIASFTQDLVNAVNRELDEYSYISVCALDKESKKRDYDDPVSMIMDGHNLDSTIATTSRINNDSRIQLVVIEHEFGLYGGEMGEMLLGFLALLEKPFVLRFHTVLPNPDERRLKIVKQIASLAERIIVMTRHSADLLEKYYDVPTEKVLRIPHGTHAASIVDRQQLKHKLELSGKIVLSTFGLLSPNKGIEKAILAMKEVSKRVPNAVYIVLGHTHPNLLESEGEKYRDYLQQLINENGLNDNVRLINEYVPTSKLMEYLTMTDIYLFTSKDPNQAVSGTFLYAMSAGCPIISNSFVLAKEMLDEKTGIILQGNEVSELADRAVYLLENEILRKQMGYNAFLKTRDTTWRRVANAHLRLFSEITGNTVEVSPSGQFIS